METEDHWKRLGHRLGRMGPPQVPGRDVVSRLREICNGCPGLTVLLGVTPAYADLGDRVLAFDGSADMIAALWPGDDARRQAHVADWRWLPVGDGVADQVLGDGSLNSLPDRGAVRAVLAEVRRVLAPAGIAAFRMFMRPEPEQTVPQVLDAARAGQIETLNVLRWRLAAALARGPGHVVRVADILTAAQPLGDLAAFAEARGMLPAQAEHLLAYRDSAACYVFPDRQALAADAAQAGLTCAWEPTAGYPGARDCPIVVLRPVG
jgi:SAM-dependent methyltransferase